MVFCINGVSIGVRLGYALAVFCATVMDEQKSEGFTPQAGVPQGGILSPLLYSLYTADIPIPPTQTETVGLYADDTAYWCTELRTTTTQHKAQRYIQRLDTWMAQWRIRPNPNKTQTILFQDRHLTRKKQEDTNDIHLTLWNTPLRLANDVRYLGVYMNKHLNWKSHVSHILNKIRKIRLGEWAGCSL